MKSYGWRHAFLIAATTFLPLPHQTAEAATERLAVYVPTISKIKDVEKALEKDPSLAGTKVTAFANFEDFKATLSDPEVTYAIAPAPYLKFYDDLVPVFQLTLKGESTFKYLVVALDEAWTKEKIAEGNAGMVNILGRENTKLYSEELLPEKKFKRIEQVSKASDLFPLLSLANAHYAIFDPRDLEAAQKEYKTKTVTVMETKPVSYPVVCRRKGKEGGPGLNLGKLKAESLKALGFDGIVARSQQLEKSE